MIRRRLSRWIVGQILVDLRPRIDQRARAEVAMRGSADALAGAIASLDRAADGWIQGAERSRPFTAETTVHRAWARHPGVRAIFERHHLPDCPSCAVGADETLAEVALGYQIPLDDLLGALNGLIRGGPIGAAERG